MLKQLIARAATIVSIFAVVLLGSGSAFAQNQAISGKVLDAGGQPVIGAAVMVPGTTNGATTDLNGNFSIRVAPGTTVEVSCIGYTTIRVTAANGMTVTLEDDTEMLEETVVIGYGVQKKSDLTGAVASVREGDLKNRSTSDAAAALQGKAAGVQILNYSGAPGEGASIRVRGYSSNSGNIGPLLIVDGLKVDNIQYLDPSMIESMEVLKDAASAAIYGAQAGNGVVLITTKSGNQGTSSITYDFKLTNQSLAKKAEILGTQEYIEQQTAIGNLTSESLNSYWDGKEHNWFDAVFAPSWSQQHGITFQGGNKNGRFFTSLNYLNNDGIVIGKKDVYTRLTAQINADYTIKPWLTIGTNNSIEKYSRKSVSGASYGSALNSVMSIDPLTPAYYSDIKDTPGGVQTMYNEHPDWILRDPNHNNDFFGTSKYMDEATGSPLIQRDRSDSSSSGINIRGALYANFSPFKGFVFTSRFGYRIAQSSSHTYTPPYYATPMAKSEEYSISANVNTSYYYQWENFANYNRTFGKHAVGAMVGMSYTENNNDNASISSQGKDILKGYEPTFRYISSLKSDATKTVSNSPGRSASLSYFGRLSYSYDNRYSIQANFRADAFDSSKLSKQARWGYFPSVSAGWTVSNESFIKDNVDRNILSFLKIRASWGQNGNVNILNNYPYAATITLNGQWYQFDPQTGDGSQTYGSGPTDLANPNLKWETSEQWDAGLDLRMFNNRLTFGFDWYRKITKDLLVQISPVPEIGVKNTYVNSGNVLNTGLEFELGWKDSIGELQYSINANFSTLHNEVLSMPREKPTLEEGGISGLNNTIRSVVEVGYPIWYFRGYKYAGVNKADGTAQYYNAAGEIVSSPAGEDRQYIGSALPKATYGLTINLAWKGFDLSVFGTGTIGNDIACFLASADRDKTNTLSYFWRNSVDKAGENAMFPKYNTISKNWNFWSSSAVLFNGSYFKFKQIQLGYTLPQNLTKKIAISNLRFYVSLDDFFTISSYPGCDPETATTSSASSMGIDAGSYPTTKKVVLGVNLTF